MISSSYVPPTFVPGDKVRALCTPVDRYVFSRYLETGECVVVYWEDFKRREMVLYPEELEIDGPNEVGNLPEDY